MKNTDRSCFFTQSMLSVGFLSLLLLSAARGQPSYTITDLGSLGAGASNAFGINDRGQVVGESNTTGLTHAFLYSGGQILDLGTLAVGTLGAESWATGINNRGQVVGRSTVPGKNGTHA